MTGHSAECLAYRECAAREGGQMASCVPGCPVGGDYCAEFAGCHENYCAYPGEEFCRARGDAPAIRAAEEK